MFERREYKQTVSPAVGPMNLDAGKPTPQEALHTGGVTLAFLFVGAIGLFALRLFSLSSFETWANAPSWKWIGHVVIIAYVCFALAFAVAYARMSLRLWGHYVMRVEEWHDAQLEAFRLQGGLQIEQAWTYEQILHFNMRDAAFMAIKIHRDVQNGNTQSLTVRGLEGSTGAQYIIADSHKRQYAGKIEGTVSEKLLDTYARLGLIEGRKERQSGRWVPQSEQEAFDMVVKRWQHKFGREG
jgi:hypothetical protein